MRSAFRAAVWACTVAVAVLAFAPLAEPPGFSYDKTNHLLAFLVLGWLADGAYPGRERAVARWGLLLTYGLLIEAVQHFLPYRHFSWLDFAADALGLLAYELLARPLRLPTPWARSVPESQGRSASAGSTRSPISSAKPPSSR